MNVLSVQSIHHAFGSHTVLRDVSASVPEGGFLCLLGPSGSGKTTLLRIIAGLLTPDSGTILVEGEDQASIATSNRDMGFVFQSPEALFPHLTVFENVAFPFRRGGRKVFQIGWRDAVHQMLERLGLAVYADKSIANLSGGEKQRVALARALAYRPTLLLLDEPLSSLDNVLKAALMAQMEELHRDLSSTFVYVTHDEREALRLATHLAVLDEGELQQFGSVSNVTASPKNARVARIIGGWHILSASVEASTGELTLPGSTPLGIATPSGASPPWAIGVPTRSLSVIPLDLAKVPSSTKVNVPAVVKTVQTVYRERCVSCALDNGETLTCTTTSDCAVFPGAVVQLSFPREEIHVFEN